MKINPNSFDELTHYLISKYKYNDFKTNFGDYELKFTNNIEKEYIIQIIKMGMWIFDYRSSQFLISVNKNITFTRANLSAFINKKIVHSFAQQLSFNNLFVGIHNDNQMDIYKNGIIQKWNKKDDFLTGFQLIFNELGNPNIQKTEHVWNYASDIESLNNFIDNKILVNNIMENYLEISIINNNFGNDDSILKLCHDILLDIEKNNKIKNI